MAKGTRPKALTLGCPQKQQADEAERARRQRELDWDSLEAALDRLASIPAARPAPFVRQTVRWPASAAAGEMKDRDGSLDGGTRTTLNRLRPRGVSEASPWNHERIPRSRSPSKQPSFDVLKKVPRSPVFSRSNSGHSNPPHSPLRSSSPASRASEEFTPSTARFPRSSREPPRSSSLALDRVGADEYASRPYSPLTDVDLDAGSSTFKANRASGPSTPISSREPSSTRSSLDRHLPVRSSLERPHSVRTFTDPKRSLDSSIPESSSSAQRWEGTFWTWMDPPAGGSKAGARQVLGKAKLLKDVPGVRRKLAKRDSSQFLSGAEKLGRRPSTGMAAAADDERSEDANLSEGSDSRLTGKGEWRKTRGTVSEEGHLSLLSDEGAIWARVSLARFRRSDIRLVHSSLFERNNCAAIFNTRPADPPPIDETLPDSASPIFVHMPTTAMLHAWLVACKSFAKDETKVVPPPSSIETLTLGESGAKVRLWRGLEISIIEGRGFLEETWDNSNGVVLTRDSRRSSSGGRKFNPTSSFSSVRSASSDHLSPTSSATKASGASPRSGHGFGTTSSSGEGSSKELNGMSKSTKFFCDVRIGQDVVGRTAAKTSSAPFWSESFSFEDIGSLRPQITLDVWQTHKNSQPSFVGSANIDARPAPRNRIHDSWVQVAPTYDGYRGTHCGDLHVTFNALELGVLESPAYASILTALDNDQDPQLPPSIASGAGPDLDRLAEVLLRIYIAQDRLLLRLSQIATLEIDGDATQAATLFRGNTLFTKMVDLYTRMIGFSFLDRSLGDVVRKICTKRVEIELDPSRIKAHRERTLKEGQKALSHWATAVWQGIYDNRHRCPPPLREIFAIIQQIVSSAYADSSMRVTSVSAFLFLRYFVPAILNPRLFGLTSQHPDAVSQRTLTLVAKTIQGLANLGHFGSKEPWMAPMNQYLEQHTDAFRDYVASVSERSASLRDDWTSKEYDGYASALRIRASAPSPNQGVPSLPHAVDINKELAQLVQLVSRGPKRRAAMAGGLAPAPSTVPEPFLSECKLIDKTTHRRLEALSKTRRSAVPLSPGQASLVLTPTPPERPSPARSRRSYTVTSKASRPGLGLRKSMSSERVTSDLDRWTTPRRDLDIHLATPSGDRLATPSAIRFADLSSRSDDDLGSRGVLVEHRGPVVVDPPKSATPVVSSSSAWPSSPSSSMNFLSKMMRKNSRAL